MRKITKRPSARIIALLLVIILMLPVVLAACGNTEETPQTKDFNLVQNGAAATIYVEGDNVIGSTTGDYPGVVRAAYDLREDIGKITGKKPIVTKSDSLRTDNAIIIGTIGKSTAIQRLIDNGKIDVSGIVGKWESYIVQTVSDPYKDGKIKTALVVAGSDKRGSIYGIYSISEAIGMTPWEFFADSQPSFQENVVFPSDYLQKGDEPDVQYRGIFINDEEDLELWGRSIDDGKHLGPELYKRIFEMLLRVKANYIWPGMHPCSDAFADYIDNPINADYFGIVVGTTHCDMLGRNNRNEWDSYVARYMLEHPSVKSIEYDYTVDPEIIREYWRESIVRSKDFEMQWTLGMRGGHDEPFTTKNIDKAPWYGDKNMLLEQIIEDQRDMLREELNNPTLENVFQMFIPYKEVQQLYNEGLELPDDITIMWANDNHGFIRNLPNEDERERAGGHGVYYHFSYWGPDNESYMWYSTIPNTLVYEELSKALAYGANKAWIVNVGDLVPNLDKIEFFMDLGYNASQYTHDNVMETYYTKLAKREFGAENAAEVTDLMASFSLIANSRKIEQQSVDIYSFNYGDEAEYRAASLKDIVARAEALYASLPEEKQDCFYEIFLFKLRCYYYTNSEFYYAHKGNLAYEQGRNQTAYNSYYMSKEFNNLRKDELSYFNNVLQDGKWKNMHDPENYVPPVMAGFANGSPVFSLSAAQPAVIVEGENSVSQSSTLKFYNYAKGRKYIDIFNKGGASFDFIVSSQSDLVELSLSGGVVIDEKRVYVEIDWDKVTASTSATITVKSGSYTKNITIQIIKDNFNVGEKTYIEQDGYVSVEAEHYSAIHGTAISEWSVIKDLGRLGGDMVRAEAHTLTGYSEQNFETNAPYLEYNIYFASTGTFETEVYRLPTLSSKGRVRFGVKAQNDTAKIIEGENDYGVGNYAWEEGVFTQIIKHKTSVKITTAGLNTIRIYMIDPYITIDKMVIYTETKQDSYFGPKESYNTTFNTDPASQYTYESFYESKYTAPDSFDIAREYGNGYFVEANGKLSIEAEAAALNSEYAYITNDRWMVARTIEGISMRTENLNDNFDNRWDIAPALNYEIIITSPGTYYFSVSINSPMPSSSVYAVGVNGSYKFLQTTYGYGREEVFLWMRAGTTLSFPTAGKYTLNFYCSQDGVSVDRFYLSKTTETPATFGFMQSTRTPIFGTAAAAKTDAQERNRLHTALFNIKNIFNISTGSALGQYSQNAVNEFYAKVDAAYAVVNSNSAVTSAQVTTALNNLNTAYNSLISSKVMSKDSVNYLVYEDFTTNDQGLAPFGLTYDTVIGSPDIGIVPVNGKNYLQVRTFKEQALMQSAYLSYRFAAKSGTVTAQAKMSFNEALWGNAIYLLNAQDEAIVSVAFEFSDSKCNIVAYNGTVKKVIGSYERNELVDIKVVANTQTGTYSVYIEGTLAAEGFAFKKSASSLSAVSFGSGSRDSKLLVEYIKVW